MSSSQAGLMNPQGSRHRGVSAIVSQESAAILSIYFIMPGAT